MKFGRSKVTWLERVGQTPLKLKIGRRLGSGSEGVVYVARDNKGNGYVIKKPVDSRDNQTERSNTDTFQSKVEGSKTKDPYYVGKTTEGALVLKMYQGQDLFNEIFRRKELSSIQKLRIFTQCVEQIQQLHAQNYVHLDIKSENFFSLAHGRFARVKVIDFGFMQLEKTKIDTVSGLGTVETMAPELLKSVIDRRGFSTDDELSLRSFWKQRFGDQALSEADEAKTTEKNQDVFSLSAVMKDDLQLLIPDFKFNLNHHFIAPDFRMLEKMGCFDPKERPNLKEVLHKGLYPWFISVLINNASRLKHPEKIRYPEVLYYMVKWSLSDEQQNLDQLLEKDKKLGNAFKSKTVVQGALMLAIEHGDQKVIEALFNQYDKTHLEDCNFSVQWSQKQAVSPLEHIARMGQVDLIPLFIQKGATIRDKVMEAAILNENKHCFDTLFEYLLNSSKLNFGPLETISNQLLSDRYLAQHHKANLVIQLLEKAKVESNPAEFIQAQLQPDSVVHHVLGGHKTLERISSSFFYSKNYQTKTLKTLRKLAKQMEACDQLNQQSIVKDVLENFQKVTQASPEKRLGVVLDGAVDAVFKKISRESKEAVEVRRDAPCAFKHVTK